MFLTTIATPTMEYLLLILTTMIFVGIPFGVLLRRKKEMDRLNAAILLLLVCGIAVVMIDYRLLIEWCISLEAPPLNVSRWNFIPHVDSSLAVGLMLAGLVAYAISRR